MKQLFFREIKLISGRLRNKLLFNLYVSFFNRFKIICDVLIPKSDLFNEETRRSFKLSFEFNLIR